MTSTGMIRFGLSTNDNFFGFRSQSSEVDILTLDSIGIITYDSFCLDLFLQEQKMK